MRLRSLLFLTYSYFSRVMMLHRMMLNLNVHKSLLIYTVCWHFYPTTNLGAFIYRNALPMRASVPFLVLNQLRNYERCELSMIIQNCMHNIWICNRVVIQHSHKLPLNVPFWLSVALTSLITPLLSRAFITSEIFSHATLHTLAHCSQPAHLM